MKRSSKVWRKNICPLFLLAFLAVPCFAGEPSILPAKPEPRLAATERGAGREFWLEAGAMGAAWTMDTVSTHECFAADPTRHEVGGLFDGSRSTAKVMAAWGAVDVAAALTAYEWKNHVRNRILHPLWRVPMLIATGEHSAAAAGNWALPAPQETPAPGSPVNPGNPAPRLPRIHTHL